VPRKIARWKYQASKVNIYINLRRFVTINMKRASELQKRNMLAFEECKSCPVKCGGGCTHYSYLTYKALNVPGDYKEKCEALRLILYKYLIAKLTGGSYE